MLHTALVGQNQCACEEKSCITHVISERIMSEINDSMYLEVVLSVMIEHTEEENISFPPPLLDKAKSKTGIDSCVLIWGRR